MTYKNPLYDITPSETGGLGLKAPSDLAVDSLATPGAVDYSLAPAPSTSPMASSEPVSPLAQLATAEPALGSGITAPANMGTTMTPGEGWVPGTATDAFSIPEAAPTSAQPELGTGIQSSPLNQIAAQTSAAMPTAQSTSTGAGNKLGLGSMSSAASMLPLLSLFGSAQTPEEVQQVVSQMTPEQQEYFNRPMRTWNWDTLNAAAKMQGLPIGSYIARNWDKVGGGAYDNPTEMARGGGVLTRLARGGGSGRDDTIPARLSDGEYVMDAETVALLGDGSTDAGARRLDQMRAKIRQHKGKSMARGKFSANAKSPLSYLKEAR
jgi:hypothetical protein